MKLLLILILKGESFASSPFYQWKCGDKTHQVSLVVLAFIVIFIFPIEIIYLHIILFMFIYIFTLELLFISALGNHSSTPYPAEGFL